MIEAKIQNTLNQIKTLEQKWDRPDHSVNLLAVSKTFPKESVMEAYQAGQRNFGENYLQDALEKIKQLELPDIKWHFIGPIQSNKTKDIAQNFHWVHTVDRIKIANRLNSQRPENIEPLSCCIQVNISEEPQKNGLIQSDEIFEIAHTMESLSNIRFRGLMAIPKPFNSFNEQKSEFDKLKILFDQIKKEFPQIDTLSMGMTNDMEAAIAAGSTWVRIGTGIFGQRQKK